MALGAWLALGVCGCDIDGVDYVRTAPPPSIIDVRVTTGIVDGAPVRVELEDDGSTRPLTSTSFHVAFDRYMDPRTLIRQAYCLRSDQADVAGFEDCIAGVADTLPRYDPVTRTLSIYLDEQHRLEPDTVYKLTLFAPREGADVGLRAFDGVPLQTSIVTTFRTLENPVDPDPLPDVEAPPPDEEAPTCNDVAFVLTRCGNCHKVDAAQQGDPVPVPEGFSVERIHLPGVVGRTAHQTQMGADANTAQERAARFGANMPLVDAKKSPGNSYLLYKMLAHTPAQPDTLAEGETERLRSSLVVGMPMPPLLRFPVENGDPITLAPLTEGELLTISSWIAAGASCPE